MRHFFFRPEYIFCTFLLINYKRVTKIDLTSSTKQILPGTNHICKFEVQNILYNEGKRAKKYNFISAPIFITKNNFFSINVLI